MAYRKRALIRLFIFIVGSWASAAETTELEPWLGDPYQIEWRSVFRYQNFSSISTVSHLKKYQSDDAFLTASLSAALPDYELEVEITQARTRKQKGDVDQLKLTGRYGFMDDVAGDFLSVTPGISYIQAFKESLRDIASFHHGLYGCEAFVSVGKELSIFEAMWKNRWWGLLGGGIAEKGSPWLRFQLNYEISPVLQHQFRCFLDSLWGLGKKSLEIVDFRGYGPISHQSIDLGLRYLYLIEFYGSASIEYSYRVYSQNFPESSHSVLVKILYQFGL